MRIGGFNPDTGRVGKLPIGCEETEACIKLTQADPGSAILYAPTARVRHHVSVDRVRMAYIARRSWCEGMSKAGVARTVGRQAALSSESRYATRVLPAALGRELRRGPRGASSAVAIVMSLGLAAAGYVRGRLSVVRPARSQAPLPERARL
jgi:hypothetical protein